MQRREFLRLLGMTAAACPLLPQLSLGSPNTGSGNGINSIETGIFELDKKILGFRRGDLVVLGGVPSMGKTHVAIQIARHCLTNNQAVAYFSIEYYEKTLLNRFIAQESGISYQKVRSGNNLDVYEHREVEFASEKISRAKLFIEDSAVVTTEDIQATLDKLAQFTKPSLVIVDYVQLMKYEEKSSSRAEGISKVLADLKKIAVRNELCVVAISQMKRIHIENFRPRLDELTGDGSVGGQFVINTDSVDKVLLLFRDGYYGKYQSNPQMEYHLVKNSSGSLGVFTSKWSI